MSKSKRNTVDPRHIITSYGADTARLFMLSDSPPERDLEWTESGIDGAWRYVNRLWRLYAERAEALAAVRGVSLPALTDGAHLAERKALHKTIAGVSEAIDQFGFNKAIALIREFTNGLEKAPFSTEAEQSVYRESLATLTRLISPFMPHLAEALWDALGEEGLACNAPWPAPEASLLVDDTVTIAVQVNGKLRGTLELAKDAAKDEVEASALALPNVQSSIDGKTIRKVIVVPGKIVNVVAA